MWGDGEIGDSFSDNFPSPLSPILYSLTSVRNLLRKAGTKEQG
jgi:hypothetical protein